MSSIGVLVCPSYYFVLGRLANEYVMIDTQVAKSQHGGNGNDIEVAFPNIENFLSLNIQRWNLCGVKGSHF